MAAPPMFVVVTSSNTVVPRTAEAGPTSVVIDRSGPIEIAFALVLLLSFDSAAVVPLSARAMMNHLPDAVPPGIVTTVVAALLAPAARAGTTLLPSNTSPASQTLLADK